MTANDASRGEDRPGGTIMNGDVRALTTSATEREALLRILSDQMETLLWTTDADLCVTSFVGGAPGHPLFGVDPVGRPVGEFFGVCDPRAVPVDAHDRALRGETVAFDIVRDGEQYEAYVEPLRDGDRVTGCVGVALRVASPVSGEDIGHSGRRLLAWGVEHDFNILVSLIQGYSRLLMRQLPPGNPLRDVLLDIVCASDRAADALNRRGRGDNSCSGFARS
jgi:hypothetical protein